MGIQEMIEEEVLTFEEVRQLLKISKSTLYSLARKGEIPAKKIGRQWRFFREDLIEWVERQRRR